ETRAGCPYGSGEALPLTADSDCPVCDGSGFEGVVATTIPHESFDNVDCRGFLKGVVRGDQADIVCDECAALVCAIPATNLQRTLAIMELMAVVPNEGVPALRDGESVRRRRAGTLHVPAVRKHGNCQRRGT